MCFLNQLMFISIMFLLKNYVIKFVYLVVPSIVAKTNFSWYLEQWLVIIDFKCGSISFHKQWKHIKHQHLGITLLKKLRDKKIIQKYK